MRVSADAGEQDALARAAADLDRELAHLVYARDVADLPLTVQRLAIARALLAKPDWLFLDEATSALDSESERAVQDALVRLMKGRTCFVVAHRLSTIRKADCVLVLDAGRIVERGTHDQLIASSGRYATMVVLQTEPRRDARVQAAASATVKV